MIRQHTLQVGPVRRGMHNITAQVDAWVRATAPPDGPALCNLFLRHTSASLLIQEGADPDVQRDLEGFLARLVPDGEPRFTHTTEGPDDMPAHVRAALTAISLTIPVLSGRLLLGTWQAIYLYEHRQRPHTREIILSLSDG